MTKNVRDEFKIALALGIDTTGGIETLEATKLTEDIKAVSSEELEAFRSAIKECDENSKFVAIDTFCQP